MQTTRLPLALIAALACLTGSICGGCIGVETPDEPPLLIGFEEPVGLLDEPDDEAERTALPAGTFTGLQVTDARRTLEALLGDSQGLLVAEVVENSPAAAAGIEAGDLLLAALKPDGDEVWLEWPSQLREIELESAAGTELTLIMDRAGVEFERSLTLAARVSPAAREDVPRLREDRRVGLVVRGATEVEARRAGLGSGGGAVVVGLAASSPWRDAGVVFGDLISAVDGASIDHPQVLLDAIRDAERGAKLSLELHRGGERASVELPVSRRKQHMRDVSIPPLYRYKARGERRSTSLVLGLARWERTDAAWTVRLLWLFSFGGGDTERLERVQ